MSRTLDRGGRGANGIAGEKEIEDKAARLQPTWHITSLIFAVCVLAFVDRMIIATLVPGIKASFDMSDTQFSLLLGPAFAFVFAFAGLPFGRLVDRANRRNLIIVGLLGFSLGTIVCGLAGSFGQLFAGRAVIGVSQAMLAPAWLSMVTDYCPTDKRGRTIGILVAAGTVGSAAASAVGGALLDMFASIPNLRIPFGGALAPWQSTLVLTGLAGLILAPVLFAIQEPVRQPQAGSEKGRIFPYLATNRATFAPLYLAFLLMVVAGYGATAWFPVAFMRSLQMEAHEVGLILGVVSLLGAFAAAAVGGWLSDRFVRRDPAAGRVRLILLLLLTSAGTLPLVMTIHDPVIAFCILGLFITSMTATGSVAYTVLMELAPGDGRGQLAALYQFLGYTFGLGMAPMAVAVITDHMLCDENKVSISILIVCVPSLLLAVVFITIALPHARKLRNSLIG